jgi:F-type H+-transporting ATPase subunit a
MELNTDSLILWQHGVFVLSATIVMTWIVMAVLVGGSLLLTRRLSSGLNISFGQKVLEIIVSGIIGQIEEISGRGSGRYLSFIGSLFLFIAMSSLLALMPGFHPPTSSLYTTAALTACVFFAVPIFGISEEGLGGFLKHYVRPTPIMLPFNIIGELSRSIAMAIRLFGNIMSDALIAGILLIVTPLFFPIILQLLGLLTGMVQAYIFAVLAMVYIASASQVHHQTGTT